MSDELMADIQRSLGRIEQKVDTALAWQQTHVAEDHGAFETIREDIRGLQIGRATQRGKVSVLIAIWTAVSGALGGVISYTLQRHVH